MAGRGTDIKLGESTGDRDQVAGLGGLLVIGTGRHESSRLDHQLSGRAGRQGDPGWLGVLRQHGSLSPPTSRSGE